MARIDRFDDTLENTHLMRLAGRFSRRIRGFAKANGIPALDCPAGEREHELADEYLTKTKVTRGLFLVLVSRAQAPAWDISLQRATRSAGQPLGWQASVGLD